jgi:rare lipoprotein A (peptidoglycan hydrolase)
VLDLSNVAAEAVENINEGIAWREMKAIEEARKKK